MTDPVVVLGLIFAATLVLGLSRILRPASIIGPSSPLWWLRFGINPTERASLGYWQIDRSSGRVLSLPEWNRRRWPTVDGYQIRNGAGRVIADGSAVWLEQNGERHYFRPHATKDLDFSKDEIAVRLYVAGKDGPEMFIPFPPAGEPKP